MYFVTANEGKTELFKTGYKVVPVTIKNGEWETLEGEKNPLDSTLFEKYEHCFNFFNDFFANKEHFFDKENGFGWNAEDFEGLDHFDVVNVVFKPDEPTDAGVPAIVVAETVSSVRAVDDYPFDLTNKEVKEEVKEDCDCDLPFKEESDFCPQCEIDKLKERIRTLEKLVIMPEGPERDELIERLGYVVSHDGFKK